MRYFVIQLGYTLFGEGDTLMEAIENANQWLDSPVNAEELDKLGHPDRNVGVLYWTTDEEEAEAHRE